MSKQLSKIGPPKQKRPSPNSRPRNNDNAENERRFDLATVCRGIITDPTSSSSDRLRAAERLAETSRGALDDDHFALLREMAELPEVELDQTFIDPDAAYAVAMLCGSTPEYLGYGEPMSLPEIKLHYPLTAEVVEEVIERRVREITGQSGPEAVERPPAADVLGDVIAADRIEEVVTDVQAQPPVPKVERSGREPYHGWPAA